ncbi:MAG: tail fiber domain-containing protein [Thermoflexales bacterium]|nr:tail fiber domain-containing protein [Thermoflexales bacterium]
MLINHRVARWFGVLGLSAIALLISFASINRASAQDNGPQSPQTPQVAAGSSFSYQGRLIKNGQPVSDTCNLSLSLWDSSNGGNFLNSNTFNSIPISNGLFTVQLDYGATTFAGDARWIETAVRCTGDANYITLEPRTKLTATPYALYSLNSWALNGNSGTAGGGFLGTKDNAALTIGVNNAPAIRIYPMSQSPNLIGGYSGNTFSATLHGQTIAGGGTYFYENRTQREWGTVGGGRSNHADGYAATIAGGVDNQATNDYTVVAGGMHNYATGSSSGIGGGFYNVAAGYVAYIGGGDLNWAMTQNATLGGGYSNTITGGQLIANNTIGGGVFNYNSGFAATIAGGHGNQATGEWTSMGGGGFNTASNRSATVSGGEYNSASGTRSTVGGGSHNVAAGTGSTIGGGGYNNSGAFLGNQTYGTASTIGGGYANVTSGDAGYGTIAGGQANQITATAGTNLNIATIGGGFNNKISQGGATIGGGNSNTASAFDSTIGGGINNTVSGNAATVPGGSSNLAQGFASFAAGYRAKAYNNGCFAWADSNDFDFGCSLNNGFSARATGGVYFVTSIDGAGNPNAGSQLIAGSSTWSTLSDRNSKANFEQVDSRALVEKLAQIPISTWNYKTQDASIRHIGPMAQDFAAAFAVGEDDKHITTVDADGVSLAAIQGLYQMIQEKDHRISQLENEVTQLKNGGQPAPDSSFNPFNLISPLLSAVALGGVIAIWARQKRAR